MAIAQVPSAAPAPVQWRRLALPAGCFASGIAGVAVAMFSSEQNAVSVVLLSCWLAYPVVGAVVLDARSSSGLGPLLSVLGLVPAVIALCATVGAGDPTSLDAAAAMWALAGPLAAAVLVGLPLLATGRLPRPRALVPLVAVGSALTFCGDLPSAARLTALLSGLSAIGWLCIATAVAWLLAILLAACRSAPRSLSRPAGWLAAVIVVAVAIFTVVRTPDPAVPPRAYLLAATLLALPVAIGTIHLAAEFPPPGEAALGVALVLTWAGTTALALVGVRAWAETIGLPSPADASAVAATLVAIGMLPVAVGGRRGVLVRRYGTGRVPTRALSELMSRLGGSTDPRDLLDVAAQAAADAVRSPSAWITMGSDEPEPPQGVAVLPLILGGDHIGTLVVEPRLVGQSFESRDLAVLEQLVVPVALVVGAVAAAVEAEHARRDERRRILADLHDGLGPTLAVLSMRVSAARRLSDGKSAAAGALDAVIAGLADSRAEVRRIVDGLLPGRLVDRDLPAAVADLVRALGPPGGPAVDLWVHGELDDLRPAVASAAYRTVAEGLTNALRHADATACTVDLRDEGEQITVQISDDGRGMPAVATPGVGLASLRQRAQQLGGSLEVHARPGGGTTVRASLPRGLP